MGEARQNGGWGMPQKRKLIVVGQGYVGLPVAIRAAEVGYQVVGIDLDKYRIDLLNKGESYVDDVPHEKLAALLAEGSYSASSNYDDANGFDIAVITVPTPLRESLPDLSFIESAARSIGSRLTSGSVVVLESTTYPGTTEELLVPLLEKESGLTAGRDFHVGYSPERIDPGNKTWGFVETPKVVSGINAASLDLIRAFYDDLVHTTVPVSSPKEAELTKLLENTFRHVNIALVNELAIFANQLGVDVWESIEAASTKPFGYMKFTPGPGVGGHCLPVDPSYLSWQVKRKLGKNFRFVELANDINQSMPDYVAQRMVELLNLRALAVNGAKVLLVGLAYKKNTGDIREAPSQRLIDILIGLNASLSAVDSHVEEHHWPASVQRVELDETSLDSYDIVVVLTDHDNIDFDLIAKTAVPVLDTKNCVPGSQIEKL